MAQKASGVTSRTRWLYDEIPPCVAARCGRGGGSRVGVVLAYGATSAAEAGG